VGYGRRVTSHAAKLSPLVSHSTIVRRIEFHFGLKGGKAAGAAAGRSFNRARGGPDELQQGYLSMGCMRRDSLRAGLQKLRDHIALGDGRSSLDQA